MLIGIYVIAVISEYGYAELLNRRNNSTRDNLVIIKNIINVYFEEKGPNI